MLLTRIWAELALFVRHVRRTLFFLIMVLAVMFLPLPEWVERDALVYFTVFVTACLLMWSDLKPVVALWLRRGAMPLAFVYDNAGAKERQSNTSSKKTVKYKDQTGDADLQLNTYQVGIRNNLPVPVRNVSVVAFAVDGNAERQIKLHATPDRDEVDIDPEATEFFSLGFALDEKRDATTVENASADQIRELLREHILNTFTVGSLGNGRRLDIAKTANGATHTIDVAASADGIDVQRARFVIEAADGGLTLTLRGLLKSSSPES